MRFLVGQGHGLAGLERRPGAPQAGAADDRRHDDVDLRRRPRPLPAPRGRRAARRPRGKPDQSCAAAAAGSVTTIQRGRKRRGLLDQQIEVACAPTAPRPAAARREAAITSSVLRPMLPVEPSTATLASCAVMQRTGCVLGRASASVARADRATAWRISRQPRPVDARARLATTRAATVSCATRILRPNGRDPQPGTMRTDWRDLDGALVVFPKCTSYYEQAHVDREPMR